MKRNSFFKIRPIATLLTTSILMAILPITAALASASSEIMPTAGGFYTTWTGTFNEVNEGTASASCTGGDYLSTATANVRETVSIPLTGIPDGATITSVNVLVRDKRESADGGTYATFVRFNGTDSADSTTHIVSGSAAGCTGSIDDAFDVTDTVKNGGTTLEIGVVKGNTTAIRIGVLSATITYSVDNTTITAGLGADNSNVGSVSWVDPGFVTTDDTNYATANISASAATHYLQATNFGFNIPSGSTIFGIQAAIGKFNSGGTGSDIQDSVVSLIKGGVITGDNKAVIGVDWPTVTSSVSMYGAPGDSWGTTWTVNDVNASDFGLALSAINANSTTAKTASVDYMQITVYYELPATTTSVDCVSSTITFGGNTVCTATVTRNAGPNTPAGSVSFTTDASGGFAASPCTLSDIGGGAASCSVTYTPSAVGDGFHLITAAYAGNTNFRGSNGNQTVTVNKIATSLLITNSPVIYNSTQQAATVVGSVAGTISDIRYSGFVTVPTDAGTYVITADFVPTDPNYASLSDGAAGNFIINKANPNCSTIAGYNITYDAISHSASGSCLGVGSDGVLGGLYLGDTTHTDVGTYNNNLWSFFDITGNYNDTSGTVNSSIVKANPICSITGYNITYDSTAHAASGSCQGVGSDGTLAGLALGATTHTHAGTYTNDPWFFTDITGNYNDDGGTINSAIAKANADCSSITAYSTTYDGFSHTATGSCVGVGIDGTLAGLYLGDTTHTPAGNYNDPWLFSDATGSYNDANGILNNIIAKANVTINVTPYNVTYDGLPHTATGTATGINSENLSILLDFSNTTHTNAGAYNSDSWSFAGNTNYNSANGTVDNNIAKANATINVTAYDVTYNGSPHTAIGTATGINNEDLSAGLDLGATTHTNAGVYNGDVWTFTNSNYNNANGTVDNNIDKSNATINVSPYDETYDSNSHTAIVTATGVNSEDLGSLLNLSGTTHTNAGVYAGDPWSFAGNTNYNSVNGTVDNNIAKAIANCTVTGYSVTYDASSHLASGSCQGVGSDGTLSGLNLSATAHTNAGTYNGDTWSFTNTNYNDVNGTVNSSIAKTNADCSSVAGYNATYDASSHTASGSCQGVGSDGTLTGLDLSATTHTNASTYNSDAWTFTDASGNYNNTNGTVNSSIGKADPNCSITGYSVMYDTLSHTASGSCQGLGSDGTLSGLDLNATTHTNAETYNGDAWTFTSSNSNYNNANGTVNNSIAKADATCTVTGYAVTHDGLPHTATGSCQGVGSDGTLSVLDLSATTHTDVGNYNNDPWAFTDASGNYNNANGTVNNIITLNQVPSLTATGGPFTYDGTAHAATINSSTPGTVSDVKYNGSSSIPVNAGIYNITADFVPDDTINYISLDDASAGSITVNKAAPNCSSITSYNVVYDGLPHTATGSCQGLGSDGTLSGLDLSATTHTNAGTYNGDAWTFTSSNSNYSNANGTINNVISKAALTVTANNQTILSGSSDPAFTFGYTGFINSETSAVLDTAPTCTVSGAHTLPGSYSIVCSGGADNNYSFNYVNGTLTVNAANSSPTDITLSNSSIDENQAVGTTIGIFSTIDTDLGDTFTYSFCGGTDDASFSISGNSLQSSATFDYETKSSYSICVRTTDSTALSFTKTLVIAVNNLVDTQTFEDVPTSYWAWNFIERLYNAGITGGCTTSPLNYCPTNLVTRDQMAVFLLKGIHGSSYSPPSAELDTGFTDVPSDYWAAAWIKQLAAESITGGCGSGIYCPTSSVTRAQMAVFLLKSIHGASYSPPPATGTFSDVPTDYWAAAWIEQLATEGITGGCGAGIYCPESPVTRDQMAVFLVKAFNLP